MTVKEICEFINIDYKEIPSDTLNIHSNKGLTPQNNSLHVKKNLILRNFGNSHYNNSLPFKGPNIKKSNSLTARGINKLHNIINPKTPLTSKINEETKVFLDNYFYEELKGINELVDKDILTKWFPQKTIANNV